MFDTFFKCVIFYCFIKLIYVMILARFRLYSSKDFPLCQTQVNCGYLPIQFLVSGSGFDQYHHQLYFHQYQLCFYFQFFTTISFFFHFLQIVIDFFPSCGFYANHKLNNFKLKFNSLMLTSQFWACVMAYNEFMFEKVIGGMRKLSKEVVDWL